MFWSIKCLLGFHQPYTVLNLKTNRRMEICKRCKTILDNEILNPCGCGKCIALNLNWNIRLKKEGNVIE